jgi:hypothetical protein
VSRKRRQLGIGFHSCVGERTDRNKNFVALTEAQTQQELRKLSAEYIAQADKIENTSLSDASLHGDEADAGSDRWRRVEAELIPGNRQHAGADRDILVRRTRQQREASRC